MIVLLIFLVVVTNVQVHSQDCFFNVSTGNSPFIVDEFFQFPTTFNFELEETFYIGCPNGTFNMHIADRGDHVACKGGTNILNIRTLEILDFNSLKCKSNPVTTVHKLDEKCENNRTLIEVGIETYDHFIPVLTVCFDEVKLATFYIKRNNTELMPIRRLKSYDDILCPDNNYECDFVDSGGMFLNTDVDSLYDNQDAILNNLGVDGYDDKLIKLPLAINTLDFEPKQQIEIYPFWDYVNAAPMWNSVFDEWLDFYLAMSDIMSYIVPNVLYAGTLGVATLPSTSGEEIELYLKDNKIPVPKWIWFLYNRPFYYKSFISLSYNNPSGPLDEDIEKICEDWTLVTKSVIYCYFDAVTDPEIRTLIDDNVCKNGDCW